MKGRRTTLARTPRPAAASTVASDAARDTSGLARSPCSRPSLPLGSSVTTEVATNGFTGVPADRIDELDRLIRLAIGFGFDQLSPREAARDVRLPTFVYQVRNDSMTRPADVQTISDNLGAEDKSLFWIENTTRRWDGCNYFHTNPAPVLDWFARHLG